MSEVIRGRLRRRIADGLGACRIGLVANGNIRGSFPIPFITAGARSKVNLRKQFMPRRDSRHPCDLRGGSWLPFSSCLRNVLSWLLSRLWHIADGLGACRIGLVANANIRGSFPIPFITAGARIKVNLRPRRDSRYPCDLRGGSLLPFSSCLRNVLSWLLSRLWHMVCVEGWRM